MAKNSASYICQSCGATFAKWSGRCAVCGNWNSLTQQLETSSAEVKAQKLGRVLEQLPLRRSKSEPIKSRLITGNSEFDVVLGGGIIPGSVILMAGEPGIGKSTILLQIAGEIANSQNSVLYVSAEESIDQIRSRAERLKIKNINLSLASTNSTDDIVKTIHESKFGLVVIDSVQTIGTELVGTSFGSPSQITNSSQILIRAAKLTNTAIVLVGHVTKEGSIAGPKLLEHLVDVVLNLEGDRYGGFKLLRSVKNRYGSTNEVGVFEMSHEGLKAIKNPSSVLLAERQVSDGSVVLATLEGTRVLLVEVQALVNKTAFGYPKRTASGIDQNRLNVLVAMLNQRTKLNLNDYDIYLNIVGGIKISEPAADLAVCMAVASAAKGLKLKTDAVVFGEVGLSGEVRHVSMMEARIKEAKKLGFKQAIGPKTSSADNFVYPVAHIREALNKFLSK